LPRTRAESIDAIMEQLGRNEPAIRVEVAAAIEDSFQFFHHHDGLFNREGQDAMVASARRIIAAVAGLQAQLEAAPELLRNFLFTAPLARIDPPQDLLAARDQHRQSIVASLQGVRLDCERLVAQTKARPGPEGDRAQLHCARLAQLLMKRFSARKISGSEKGPFRLIAGLLYEALTGREEVDLKRHCDAVMKAPI
jgi:hypothetical protein